MKLKDLLGTEFSLDEFWAVVDALPDEVSGKKQKANINAFFKKNGDPKKKKLITDEDYQVSHDTQGFIRRWVRTQIHVNKLKARRDATLKKSKEARLKKKQKGVKQDIEKISPLVLRHKLVVEYNRLIREGNPDTKELREQINDQIQKIESEAENEGDVTS